MSKQIQVGSVAVGGGAPVSIQSMCNTPTQDVAATVSQILRLEKAGCEIIRVAVPDQDAARAVGERSHSLKQLKWIASHILELISGLAFVVMITVVFANVLLRFITGKSLIWTEEVAAIGFIWSIFLGAAVCYKQRGGLISMDVLIGGLHGKARKYADLILDALQVVLCIVFFSLSWKFAMSASNKFSLALNLPYTIYDIPVAISFVFMAYYAGKRTVEDIKNLKNDSGDTEKGEC